MKTMSPAEQDIAVKKVLDLDLSILRLKTQDPEEGYGWDSEMCDVIECRYREFLILNIKYPDTSIVPDTDEDKLWHTHILDTRKYIEDCNNIFGEYFHHYPYFGLNGEDDAENLNNAFLQTNKLRQKEFPQLTVSTIRNESTCAGRCSNRVPYVPSCARCVRESDPKPTSCAKCARCSRG
jgi:hypothetical protein